VGWALEPEDELQVVATCLKLFTSNVCPVEALADGDAADGDAADGDAADGDAAEEGFAAPPLADAVLDCDGVPVTEISWPT